MKRLIVLLAVLVAMGVPDVAVARAGGYATMHSEKQLPRPPGVSIAGASPDQVVLYCTTVSAGCKGLRAHLAKRGIGYLDKELTTDPVAQAEFEALGGLGVPLMVFKDTLLHSYYPTSFERVYAEQASGRPAERAANAGAGQTRAPAGDRPSQSAATPAAAAVVSASPVEAVAPAAIAAYIQSHPDVLVQFTSPDARCRYCVEAYPGFDAAARTYGRAVKFARVEWTPWNQFPKEVEALHGGYAPAQIAYRSGKESARFDGSLMNRSREFGAFVKQSYALGHAYPASAVAVDELQPEELAAYLARYPRVAVQLTSPDPNCQPCAAGYAAFDAAAATHGQRIRFARVQWMPWQTVPDSLKQTYAPRVVPEIKGFKDGQLAGTLSGIPQARLDAWLNQQFGAQP
jgi:predicted DsbA family dithiol-disulfide isomerase